MAPRPGKRPLWILALLMPLASAPAVGAEEPSVTVTVTSPRTVSDAHTLGLTGTVTAERRAQLSPRVSGLVAKVAVDAGHEVKEGDVLLELDRSLAWLEVKRTRAALGEARTRLAELRRLATQAESLGEKLAASERETRQAEAAAQAATVDRLEAELGVARERLARHRLVAPFDGVISRRLAEAGEWVDTGTPVLELVGLDRLRLDLQVPQEYLGRLDLEAPVRVRPAHRDGSEPLEGRVLATVPVTDPNTRTFLVRVVMDNPSHRLYPGLSAEAALPLSGGDATGLAIPRDALMRYPDGSTSVWVVVGANGTAQAEERQVRVAPGLGDTVEVLEGLASSDRVVVRGNERLRQGQSVRIADGR